MTDSDVPARPQLDDELERERVRVEVLARLLAEEPSESPKIGRFAVLRRLGQGGMGVVYAVYDDVLDRQVALKLIVQGSGTRARARSRREAQALARLSHPNVVQVYEVGEHEGGLFIVMEHVRGETLAAWQSSPGRSWRGIVDAYVQAAEGLSAAHDSGLIHRDFKPHNAIVTPLDDGKIRVRVLDFGLALSDETAHSMERAVSSDGGGDGGSNPTLSNNLAGTPAYMAPEQFDGASVGPSADQFSFCVSLWEALHGERPHAGTSLSALRIAVASGAIRSPPSGTRVPGWVRDVLTRGLAVSPDERHPSMRALADALRRDPARRRRRVASVASTVVAAAVVGAAATAWFDTEPRPCSGAGEELAGVWDADRRTQVERAMRGTDQTYAEAAWLHTADVLDGYAEQWSAMHVEACEATLRGEQSDNVLDRRVACLRRAASQLDSTAAVLADADAQVVANAHELVGSLDRLERCADVEALLADVAPPAPDVAEAVESSRNELADARSLRASGRYAASLAATERAAAQTEAEAYPPVQSEIAVEQGLSLEELGRYEEALERLRRAVKEGLRSGQREVARTAMLKLIYVLGHDEKRHDEALALRDVAEGMCIAPEDVAALRNTLGLVLQSKGEFEAAEAQLREAAELRLATFGEDDRRTIAYQINLASLLGERGRYADAAAAMRDGKARYERLLGSGHPDLVAVHSNLGTILQSEGKVEEAEAEHRKAVALVDETLGPRHPFHGVARANLGNTLYFQRNYAEAASELARAVEELGQTFGEQHVRVASIRANLGAALYALGKHVEAEREIRAGLEIKQAELGPNHPYVANGRMMLAGVLDQLGRHEDAIEEMKTALAIRERELGEKHPEVAMANLALGELFREHGDVDKAMPLLERAWALRDNHPPGAYGRAAAAFALAQALWDGGRDRARARDLAGRSVELFDEAGPVHGQQAADVRTWLDAHRG